MKKLQILTLASVVTLGALNASAKKDKVFYDSKSHLIGVSGAVDSLRAYGFDNKIFVNNIGELKTQLPVPAIKEKEFTPEQILAVQESLQSEGAGKRILDYLYQFDGTTLSEDNLKSRALQNARTADIEIADYAAVGGQNMLQEDVVPIMAHNYIYLENRHGDKKLSYMVFRTDMNEDTWRDVMSNWNNPAGYNQIQVPLVYVASGTVGYNPSDADDKANIQSSLARNVGDFAIRGTVKQRNPMIIAAGSNEGVKKGDLISIYRQFMSPDSIMYSKRISRFRAGDVEADQATLFNVAGTKGSRKNGDIAVVTRDKKMSMDVYGVWMPHNWSIGLGYDYKIGFTKRGLVFHVPANVEFGLTEKPSETFTDGYNEFKSPIHFNVTVGVGASYTLWGFMDLKLWAQVGYEYAMMLNKDTFSLDSNANNTDNIAAGAVRVPIGLDIAFNIAYPWQLFLSGGYAFNFGLNDDNNAYKSYDVIKEAYGILGNVKRQGVFLRAGVRFNF